MNGLASAFAAIGVTVFGLVSSGVGAILSAAGSSEIAPWAQVTGTAAAVGGLAYVAKLMADGRLVAQPVAKLLEDSAERERKLGEYFESSREREDAFRAFLIQRGGGR